MRRWFFLGLALSFSASLFAQDAGEPDEVKAVRKRLPGICKKLEEIRGLPFKNPVKVEYQSQKAFRDYITKDMDSEMPMAKAAETSRLYVRLGLAKEGFNVRSQMTDLVESAAFMHYNPNNDTFYVLKTGMGQNEVDSAALHELQHAIQDQYFAIDKLMKAAGETGRDDAATAVRFLIEGEATYVMMIDQLKTMGMGEEMVSANLGMVKDLDRERFIQMQKMQMGMMGAEARKTMEKQFKIMAESPRYLYRTLTDPYIKGAAMVSAIKSKGGWKAVEELFKNPPTSTEQVLHPEKLIGERDEPQILALPDLSSSFGEGWSRRQQNSIGELGVRTVFREVVGSDELAASAGWDGDQVASYETEGARSAAIVWATVWDSEGDAREFAVAYKKAMFKKYSQEPVKSQGGVISFTKDGEDHLITLQGDKVFIVEGAPQGRGRAILDAAVSGVKSGAAAPTTPRPTTGAKRRAY